MAIHSLTRKTGLLLLTAALLPLQSWADSTRIVFVNNTGVPDDALFVNLQGNGINTVFSGVNKGDGSSMSLNNDYSLADLYGTVSGSGGSGPTGTVPTFTAEQFYNGGVVNITLGNKIGSSQPATNVVSGRFEIFANNSSSSNNVDASYVSSVSMPLSYSIKRINNGSLVPLSGQTNQINTTGGSSLFNALTASTTTTPNSARISANYSAVNSNNNTVGTVTGIASIQSPQNNTDYHGWTGPTTGVRSTSGLIPWLTSQDKTIKVANYDVPNEDKLGGTKFGFVGSGGTSPFNQDGNNNDPSNLFTQAQSYDLDAKFETDIRSDITELSSTANDNVRDQLETQGIDAATAGARMVGEGGEVGDIIVYSTNSELDSNTGIYGANPQYIVVWNKNGDADWNGAISVTTQNLNNLTDRIVGDLLTAINMGMADSQTVIGTNATNTGTTGTLDNTIFAAAKNSDIIGDLTTGEFIYLLSLQFNPTGNTMSDWFGGSIESNELFYNTYASVLAEDTDAYTLSYSDRLSGDGSPDLFYTPEDLTVPLDELYIEIILEAGGFTYTPVPEPSQITLLLGLGGLGLLAWRRRRT